MKKNNQPEWIVNESLYTNITLSSWPFDFAQFFIVYLIILLQIDVFYIFVKMKKKTCIIIKQHWV